MGHGDDGALSTSHRITPCLPTENTLTSRQISGNLGTHRINPSDPADRQMTRDLGNPFPLPLPLSLPHS
jgi:hypothetical protein